MPDFHFENTLCECSDAIVVGVDEVGYGSLAGPVVSAAVFIVDRNSLCISSIKDSKKLSPKQREIIFEQLTTCAICSVGFASVSEIDTHNILIASHISMQRALAGLNVPHIDLVLIDGIRKPELSWKSQAIIKGDEFSTSIAAASIVAKVTRDRYMKKLHAKHSEYSWDKNCGYGTKAHILALEQYGPTEHHRQSFAPIKKYYC